MSTHCSNCKERMAVKDTLCLICLYEKEGRIPVSNKPNVDELNNLPNYLLYDLRMLAEKHYGNATYGDHLPYQHELQCLLGKHLKTIVAQAKQQTCDDIVGLVKNEMETAPILLRKMHKIQIEFTQWLIDNRNDCRTQTIDAINKYKGEM